MRRAEGGAKNFGVFRWKKYDFTAKKSYSFQLRREARKILGYFVWKITILRQKIIFFPILGGRAPGAPPPPPWIRPCKSTLFVKWCGHASAFRMCVKWQPSRIPWRTALLYTLENYIWYIQSSRHSSLQVFIRPDIKNGQLDWIHANEPKPAKNCLLQVDYHIKSSIVAIP